MSNKLGEFHAKDCLEAFGALGALGALGTSEEQAKKKVCDSTNLCVTETRIRLTQRLNEVKDTMIKSLGSYHRNSSIHRASMSTVYPSIDPMDPLLSFTFGYFRALVWPSPLFHLPGQLASSRAGVGRDRTARLI